MFYIKNNFCEKQILTLWALILFSLFRAASLSGQPEPEARIKKMLNEINQAKNDSLKIVKYNELAFFYCNYIYDNKVADSLSRIAVKIAEKNTRPGLKLLAYNYYIESVNPEFNKARALDYINKAATLIRLIRNTRVQWRTYRNQFSVWLSCFEYKRASEDRAHLCHQSESPTSSLGRDGTGAQTRVGLVWS